MPLQGTRGKPAKILVVDDDEDMRCLIVHALTRAGHDVGEARDGGELVERVVAALSTPNEPWDLVISDVRMPGSSGLSAARLLRAREIRVPILLMTAFPDGETRMHAGSVGALLFEKPFALEDLLLAVRGLLALGPV
jgi:DNA-binding response OmpR family regulator